jgi:ribosomal protein S18 acetylase RimI-like enzyme
VPERAQLTDADGRPVLAFVVGTRAGRSWANGLEVLGPGAVERILAEMPGWMVNAPTDLGWELVARGATLRRHAHTMALDLDGWSPPVADPPSGVRFTPCDRPAGDLVAAHVAAYGPGHVDHNGETAAQAVDELARLISGDLVGPLLGCSRLAVAGDGAVVAGALVNDMTPMPFVTNVFRDPARSPAGTGTALLATALAAAAAAGIARIGLAVTDGNPAQRVYERLGFAVVSTVLAVVVPPRSSAFPAL